MEETCFYHDNAYSNNIALYRIKYNIGYAPELIDPDRDICKMCYKLLTKPLDILKELSQLATIRERHRRVVYIEPIKKSHSIIVVMKAPDREELENELNRNKKFNETTIL